MTKILDYFKTDSNVGLGLLDPSQHEQSEKYNSSQYSKFKSHSDSWKDQFCKKLDSIREHDVYGFTLTFRPKTHEIENERLHAWVKDTIRRSRLWKKTKYCLFPELTSEGKLHYHGIMYDTFQCDVMKIMKKWKREYGFYKVEINIRNYVNWINYIMKHYGKAGLSTIHNII